MKKHMTASLFRIIMSVTLVLVGAIVVGAFLFGYSYIQSVGEETSKRQADADASEDSLANLQTIRNTLSSKTDTIDKLNSLQSSSTFPQFDTERSLRTITRQLGLSVSNISFVNDDDGQAQAASDKTKTSPAKAGRNSKISFELSSNISYYDLLRFLNAVETSTPKLKLSGLSAQAVSNGTSVETGPLTLEMGTTP